MSRSFQFPLQRVLNVREIIEETKSLELKRSQSKLEIEKNQLKILKDRKDEMLSETRLKTKRGDRLTLNSLQISSNYVSQLNESINGKKIAIDKSAQLVEKDRSEVLKASREKKIVEILKDQHLQRYIKDLNRAQEKEESEIGLRISAKRKAEIAR
ncbi:MAG: flagellar export protein FliJ [FCB group bacterium]|nr:flagellar export protein FliJ [FCB group bacterium]